MILIAIVLAYIGHYLLARAQITSWLWSRYPKWFDAWASCPACCGAWTGFLSAMWLNANGYALAPLRSGEFVTWLIMLCVCMFTTPLLAFVHLYAASMTTGNDEG